jgi:predicted nucleic acid-binding protein
LAAAIRMIVPGIADYELRRELIRAGKTSGVRRLDAVRAGFEFDPITQDALDKAAELCAAVRNSGMATAHPAALDGDAILGAQTILAANASEIFTIVTSNARHLSRFPAIDARPWQSITS